MRILQITAFSGWGCTGRIALGIHNVLITQGYEGAIAWGRINTVPDAVPTIKIGNRLDQQMHGFYTRITDKCGFGSKKVTKKFLRKLDEYKPDLVQLHIMHGYYINIEILFNYFKERNIKVVWTFHDCWAFTGHCPYFDLIGCEKWKSGCHDCQQKKHHPKSWLLDNSSWNWSKKRTLFTGINDLTIVTPSEWLSDLVKQSFLKDCRVAVINNGIDLNNFRPTVGNVHEKYGIQGKKIILGVSSSWVKSKGLDDFIYLSKILPHDYVIVLVGLAKKQKDHLPENMVGIVRTDNVHDLAELYSAATVFVNPTYEDNYPTTNLEALACGTPVITYRTGGSIEPVKESGYGAIVLQGDVCGLRNSILTVTNNMIKERRVYASDANLNYEKYVKLYREILCLK